MTEPAKDVVQEGGVKKPECGSIKSLFHMCASGEAPPAKAPSLGTGMAENAKQELGGRQAKLNAAITAAGG